MNKNEKNLKIKKPVQPFESLINKKNHYHYYALITNYKFIDKKLSLVRLNMKIIYKNKKKRCIKS